MSNEILNNYVEEEDIDLIELFFVLSRKWWLLIICAIAGAAIALTYTLFLVQPIYTSSSMIYIFSKSTTITSAIDLQIGEQLTIDFEILGKSRPVIEKVISDLELDTTYEDLLETVTVENPTDSRIIKITVENTDPQLASDIANCLADNLSARVAEVIDTDKPSSVESAVPADIPSSPSIVKNTVVGGVLGFIFVAAIVLIQYYSDMSIKDEDDVRKYLGMGTLASIPYEKSISAERDGKKTKRHKKRRK